MMAALHRPPAPRRLSTLLEGVARVAPQQDREITGIAGDSRKVRPGDLFFARAGVHGHGLDHLDQAVAAGAAAVVWEAVEGVAPLAGRAEGVPLIAVAGLGQRAGEIAARFYGEPAQRLFTVGVTGTNGKTSVSQFVARALATAGRPCGVIGTLGFGVVGAGPLEEATHTTPDALEVQRLLAGFVEAGAGAAALEVSSHGLEQGRVQGVEFDVALFTNLSRDHLDYHGDMAAYGAAKRRLFTERAPRFAVINGDDPFGAELLATLPAGVDGYGYTIEGAAGCAIRGRVTATGRGLSVAVSTPWGEGRIESPLLGRFNAANLLAALGALLLSGMGVDEACERLGGLGPVAGRMEALGGGDRPLVVVDYAHTPDALAQALTALRPHCAGRLTCLFGCGGERDRGKRPEMGAAAERLADRVVVTDDNPRGEEGAAIVAEILAGMNESAAVTVERDRARAIAEAVASAGVGDVVLVAGKGHEAYQQIGSERRPFSDVDEVRAALAAWNGNN